LVRNWEIIGKKAKDRVSNNPKLSKFPINSFPSIRNLALPQNARQAENKRKKRKRGKGEKGMKEEKSGKPEKSEIWDFQENREIDTVRSQYPLELLRFFLSSLRSSFLSAWLKKRNKKFQIGFRSCLPIRRSWMRRLLVKRQPTKS
jgi:hypothetical protein